MKKILVFLALLCSITGCYAQNDKSKIKYATNSDTVHYRPQVNWKVNKEFDKQGNLIRYDSTYSWSYSGNSAKLQIEDDSLFNSFKKQFDFGFPSFTQEGFDDLIWSDSLFYNDLIAPDHFLNKWEQQFADFRKRIFGGDTLSKFFLKE